MKMRNQKKGMMKYPECPYKVIKVHKRNLNWHLKTIHLGVCNLKIGTKSKGKKDTMQVMTAGSMPLRL